MLTDSERQELLDAAKAAQKAAYAPYSEYLVGAAVLTQSGNIYQGANIENAAYPDSICAERVAIFKAVFNGDLKFKGIAVVTRNGGAPCGSCRQVMSEFGLEPVVLLANQDGEVLDETTVDELLPGAFVPGDLLK